MWSFETDPEFDEDEEFNDQFDEDSLPDIDVQIAETYTHLTLPTTPNV